MTVNGLSPGVSYTFYLAAGNAVGIGTAVKFRVRTPRRVSQNQQSGNERCICVSETCFRYCVKIEYS